MAKHDNSKSLKTIEEFEQKLRKRITQGDALACLQLVEHFERKGMAPHQLEAHNRINLLREASNKGIGAASVLLGNWYLKGHYVKQDPAQAILFFEHAGKVCKDAYGYYKLAEMFQRGLAVQAQPEKGLQYLKKAMDMGNADAIFTYASQIMTTEAEHAFHLLKDNYKKHGHLRSLLCLNDSSLFKPEKTQLFFESNHQNDAYISSLLAWRYLKVHQYDQALPLSEFAVSQNNPIGYYVRALIELNRPDGDAQYAQQMMVQAAQSGHVEAAYHAAITLLEQFDGIQSAEHKQKALQQALSWLGQSAQAGFAPAQFSLGQCWLQGIGVVANTQEAFGWLERAAQQGHVDAIFSLAINLPSEHQQHLPLLHAAAQAGHTKAMLCIGLYLQKHQQPNEAIPWFEQAKQGGDQRANYMLGLAYRDGVGVEVDSKRAVQLLKSAGESGDADAYFVLYQSYKQGIAVRKNKKSQDKYLKLAQQAGHPQALQLQE